MLAFENISLLVVAVSVKSEEDCNCNGLGACPVLVTEELELAKDS